MDTITIQRGLCSNNRDITGYYGKTKEGHLTQPVGLWTVWITVIRILVKCFYGSVTWSFTHTMSFWHHKNLETFQCFPIILQHWYYFNFTHGWGNWGLRRLSLSWEIRKVKQFVLVHTVGIWLTRDLNTSNLTLWQRVAGISGSRTKKQREEGASFSRMANPPHPPGDGPAQGNGGRWGRPA